VAGGDRAVRPDHRRQRRSRGPTLAGWLTGPTIYAGSAQVAAIELLDVGAGPAVVVLTVLIINLRLVFHSDSSPQFGQGLSEYAGSQARPVTRYARFSTRASPVPQSTSSPTR